MGGTGVKGDLGRGCLEALAQRIGMIRLFFNDDFVGPAPDIGVGGAFEWFEVLSLETVSVGEDRICHGPERNPLAFRERRQE
jgi:hypothetical protein